MKIDNLIKLIIRWKRFRWNHHFSSRLTFCCIIVSVKVNRTIYRAISQNMPTIVYQTNRYWLSRYKKSSYDSPDNTRILFEDEINFLYDTSNVMSHDQHLHLHHLPDLHHFPEPETKCVGSISTNQVKLMKVLQTKNWHVSHCDRVNGPCQQILPSLK